MIDKIIKYGSLVFDYIMITIIFIASLILVLPFISVYIGIIGYFEKPLWERELLDIFRTIRSNFKIILKVNFLVVVMLVASLLNLNYFKEPNGIFEIIIMGASWIILIVAFIILIFSPIIIIKMNVNLKQVVFNSFALIMGGLFNYLLLIALCYLYIYFSTKFLLVLILGVYFVTYSIHYLSSANINNLKFKGGVKV
ncbi:TPA: hypothetical protein GXZ54_02470 [bacterium]|nr:hypothetical protein [bacterium]